MLDLPIVKRKSGDQPYDYQKIVVSLVNETDLNKDNALLIAQYVTRFIMSNNLSIITAPLIREITNVCLLKKGFEKQRLQYTRIGMPYYDFKKTNKSIMLRNESEIYEHILQEWEAVGQLIEECDEK